MMALLDISMIAVYYNKMVGCVTMGLVSKKNSSRCLRISSRQKNNSTTSLWMVKKY